MRRFGLFLCLLLAAPCWGRPVKAVPLEVSGDTVTIIKGLPCKVTARAGADLYLWNVPAGVTATSADNVLTVTAAAKGTYTVSVVAITVDFEKKKLTKDSGEVVLNVGEGPAPPGPKPPDPPGPTPGGPLRVLIVYESADLPKLPKEQQAILFDMKVRGALKDRTDKAGPDGRGFNIWDKDIDATGAAKFWRDALKRSRSATPFIHLFKGDAVVHEGPLPANVEDALTLINKYGG